MQAGRKSNSIKKLVSVLLAAALILSIIPARSIMNVAATDTRKNTEEGSTESGNTGSKSDKTQEVTEDDTNDDTTDAKKDVTYTFQVLQSIVNEENGDNQWNSSSDSGAKELNNAVIKVSSADENFKKNTDEKGNAEFSLKSGTTYTYEISKVGYTKITGSFTTTEAVSQNSSCVMYSIRSETVYVKLSGIDKNYTDSLSISLVSKNTDTTSTVKGSITYSDSDQTYYARFANVYQSGSYDLVFSGDAYDDLNVSNRNYSEFKNSIADTITYSVQKKRYNLVLDISENADLASYVEVSGVTAEKDDTAKTYTFKNLEYGTTIKFNKPLFKSFKYILVAGTDVSSSLVRKTEGLSVYYEYSLKPVTNNKTAESGDISLKIATDIQKVESITGIKESDSKTEFYPDSVYTFIATYSPEDGDTSLFEWSVKVNNKVDEDKASISALTDKSMATLTLGDVSSNDEITITVTDNATQISKTKTIKVKTVSGNVEDYFTFSGEKYGNTWYISDVTASAVSEEYSFRIGRDEFESIILQETTETTVIVRKNNIYEATVRLNVKIDKTNPYIANISETLTKYGDNIIQVTDTDSGVAKVTYQKCDIDGNSVSDSKVLEAVKQSEGNYSINLPMEDYVGYYLIIATDNTGHTSQQIVAVNTDITAPEITIKSGSEALENESYVNNNVSLNIESTDNQAVTQGNIVILKDNEKYIESGMEIANGIAQYSNTLTEEGVYTISVTTKDSHNNSKTESRTVTVDKTAPVVTITFDKTSQTKNGTEYFKEAVNAVIEIQEKNFDESQVTIETGIDDYEVSWTHSGDKHTMKISYTQHGSYEISVSGIDLAGNKSEKTNSSSKKFAVDLAGPDIEITYDNNEVYSSDYFNGSRTATIVIKEDFLDLDTIELNAVCVDGDNQPVISEWTHEDNIHTVTVKFEYDGEYELEISCEDYSGRENNTPVTGESAAPWHFVIDNTNPVIKVTYDKTNYKTTKNGTDYYNGKVTAVITITEHNFDPSLVNITLTGTDASGNSVYVPSVSSFAANGDTHTAYVTYETDGNFSFDISCTDKSNLANKENLAKKLTVDSNAPTGYITAGNFGNFAGYMSGITYKLWTNNSVNVSMTCQDSISGIESIKYIKTSTEKTLDELRKMSDSAWKDYAPFTVNSDELFIVYAKVTDNAQNVYYMNTNGIIVDKTAPSVEKLSPEITINQPVNDIYNGNVTVDLTVTDPIVNNSYSGLNIVSYRVIRDNNVVTQQGVLYQHTNTNPVKSQLVQNFSAAIVVDAALNNSNNVVIEITSIDNSGNAVTERTSVMIDITAPVMTVSYDNNNVVNNRYFSENRTATITIYERNFSAEDVNLMITNTLGTAPVISNWVTYADSDPDNTRHVATVTYSVNGDYTFNAAYSDRAGNLIAGINYTDSVCPNDFTIDKNDPVLSLTYNNNNAVNGNYYNQDRVATITINEHNFDASGAVINVTAADGATVPYISGFTANGDVHTANITFAQDGYYTIEITYTDLAGRTAAPVTLQNFYIDKTSPSLTISGVENNMAYNSETIAPVITTTDNYFDSSNVTISLTGVNRGSVPISGHYEEIANGRVFIFDNFENIKDVDDIYTLTVAVTDKAGNHTEQTVNFSVNRFGSTYSFDDQTSQIRNKYINSAVDVVIYETNVTPLDRDSIKIKIARDNSIITLREGVNYIVTETSVNGGWYQYEYKIFKNNFDQEGAYRVIIHSVDGATNISENNMEEKDAALSFAVDKTSPVGIMSGVLSNRIYNSKSKKVVLAVADNFDVTGVYIYVNGQLYQQIDQENDPEVLAAIYENSEIEFELSDSNERQNIEVVMVDAAGNEQRITINNVLVSTNVWVRFYEDKPLFYSVMGLIALIICGIVFIVWKKKKEKEQRADSSAK